MSNTIYNEASTTYMFDGSSETNTATSNTNTVILQSSSGITLSKTGTPTSFLAGDIITYRVTITNSGSYFFNGVRIIDNLGGGNLAYVVGSASLTVGSLTYPVTPVATNPLTFTLQQLNVGATMVLTYRAQVIYNLPSSVTSITNSVRGIGYTSTGTEEGTTSFTIQKKTSVGLTIEKTANVTDVFPNESFNYILTLSNNNVVDARILSLIDQLPNNFILTSVTIKIGSSMPILLDPSDYTLSSGNLLTIPSPVGPLLIIPAGENMVVTLTGYFN